MYRATLWEVLGKSDNSCFCRADNDNIFIYRFPYTLDNESLSLANNFFSDSLQNISLIFQEKLMPSIRSMRIEIKIQEAIQEFNLLRSKAISERDFCLIKREIREVDDPIQYIADIKAIIQSANEKFLFFRREYNKFFGIGGLILPSILEGSEEEMSRAQTPNIGKILTSPRSPTLFPAIGSDDAEENAEPVKRSRQGKQNIPNGSFLPDIKSPTMG